MIGNLLPLEEELNRSCKDKPLKDKVLIYEKSNFFMARNISKRYKDKEESFNIISRSERMASEIYNEMSLILKEL